MLPNAVHQGTALCHEVRIDNDEVTCVVGKQICEQVDVHIQENDGLGKDEEETCTDLDLNGVEAMILGGLPVDMLHAWDIDQHQGFLECSFENYMDHVDEEEGVYPFCSQNHCLMKMNF